MKGFLGWGATFRADLNLIVQLAMGLALLAGMILARRRRFSAHRFCQSSVVLLNLAMIALVMAPSFHQQVMPKISSALGDHYYLFASLHAGLGIIAEFLALYIILRAATGLLPESLRFKRYKPWMRTALALWWVTLVLGVGTYYHWYVLPARSSPTTARPGTAAGVKPGRETVTVRNFDFEPKQLNIATGATVEWIDEGGRHSVEADDGSFKSEVLVAGDRFEHKFDMPGVFAYHCGLHGAKGGKDMAGEIIVRQP